MAGLTGNNDILSLTSFNCNGYKSSIYEINKLASFSHMICVQELWLDQSETEILNNTVENFNGYGLSPIDPSDGILTGRKYGGVGFLWNTKLSRIKIIKYEENWLLGIEITNENKTILIINVYLPYNATEKC